MASIDGNGSTKATATPLYFQRIPILAPRYIRLEKRGIFRVPVEQKFGKGLFSGFKGWMLSFYGRGSRQEAA